MRKSGLLVLCVLVAGGGGCAAKAEHGRWARTVENYRRQVALYKQQTATFQHRLKQTRTSLEILRAKYTRLRTGCSERHMAARIAPSEQIRARTRIWRMLRARFRRRIRARSLSIRMVHGRILVTLRSSVLFDPGKDRLKKRGRNLLAELALELKHLTDRHVHVAGHTDDLRIRYSRFRSNWELSALRAVRVVRFLRKLGVKPYRLSAGGFAEYQPLTENASWQGRWLNGRIEISLLPAVLTNPLDR